MDNFNIIQNLQLPPLLCYSFDQDPNIINSNNQIDITKCNGFNFNQFTRVNGMYSLTINTQNQSFKDIRLLFFISGAQVSYSLTARAQYSGAVQQQCAFDCQNPYTQISRGTCSNAVCTCNVGFVDEDCSTEAILITDKSQKKPIDGKQMYYYYYLPSQPIQSLNSASDLTIQINLLSNNPPIDMFVSIQGVDPKKIIPTSDIYLMHTQISSSSYTLTLKGSGQYDNSGNPKYTVFGFTIINQGSSPSNIIQISISSSSGDISNTNLLIIYFLVGIVALLFLIWIILTIIKIRYARRNQILDLTMAQAQVNAAQQRVQQRRGQSNKLTIEIIDEFLPALSFEDIKKKAQDKGKTLNDSCAVCLCEFENSDICRETICNHYFHKDCLEQWLKKQENCPFCRTDLQKNSLIKHFNQIKMASEQSSERNQGDNAANANVANNNNIINESQPLRNQANNQSVQPSNVNLVRNNAVNQSQSYQVNNQDIQQNGIQRRNQNQLSVMQRNPSQRGLQISQPQNNNQGNNINIVNQSNNNDLQIQNLQ
ncbi:RING-H2 zinc finger protein (macronuclear) [Tetrahymena thermophila SB210]|uniref:RING-H2 zinc finger protein n=1 Tax=Tetrahymena thermophila (strain SB210) TaxID=312017 RepID=I7MJD0_TETTS|nr:RING-H2 zinc finger protein [Tetrahymena thermophila SB210]EAR96199.1 RING-H2 zinc finger protein [Tetrahymena thermophila SB210]|eukprot:XP_001016444.1 RING-H2 zinc finger protein [Tetrahymena thermophila SB210]